MAARVRGTREEVWAGLAVKTSGGLTRDDLMVNPRTGKLVSRRRSEAAKARFPAVRAALCATADPDDDVFRTVALEILGEGASPSALAKATRSVRTRARARQERTGEDLVTALDRINELAVRADAETGL